MTDYDLPPPTPCGQCARSLKACRANTQCCPACTHTPPDTSDTQED